MLSAFIGPSLSGVRKQGAPQQELNLLRQAEVSRPVPNEHAFGADDQVLTEALQWNTSQLCTSGVLSVGLPGDFNNDGRVNAADYVVWRKCLGTIYLPSDYDVWRARFGQTAGSGSGAASLATVPEPALHELWILAPIVIQRRRRIA